MSRIKSDHDKLLGTRYDPKNVDGVSVSFVSVARKIGFNEQEIDELNEIYSAELEEAKHEYR
jgi:hypothetical protein